MEYEEYPSDIPCEWENEEADAQEWDEAYDDETQTEYCINMILVGDEFVSNEYFDITNIDYYNVILGTPFLMKWGISLDFGRIRIKGWIVPQGRLVDPADTPNAGSTGADRISLQ
jgi:hypothetical protein